MNHDYSRSYSSADEGYDFQLDARLLVARYYNQHIAFVLKTPWITTDEVYVVWFSKTLKNWKALLSTTKPDGRYYEVTHNGEKGETYLDEYQKQSNVCYDRKRPLPNLNISKTEYDEIAEGPNLESQLTSLLNKYSAESVSGTPDFILAGFLMDSIRAFNAAVVGRADWRGEPVEFNPTPEPKDELDEDSNSVGCDCGYCRPPQDFAGETPVRFEAPGFSAEMFIEDITKPEVKCDKACCNAPDGSSFITFDITSADHSIINSYYGKQG